MEVEGLEGEGEKEDDDAAAAEEVEEVGVEDERRRGGGGGGGRRGGAAAIDDALFAAVPGNGAGLLLMASFDPGRPAAATTADLPGLATAKGGRESVREARMVGAKRERFFAEIDGVDQSIEEELASSEVN